MELANFVLAADLGNYEIKSWIGEGYPSAIRSVRSQLSGGTRALKSDDTSPLIEYQGQRYHFGHRAYHYRSRAHTVDGDKVAIALLSTLACCTFPDPEYCLQVRTSHPTPDLVTDRIQHQLLGTHHFKRNNVSHVVHITDVEVWPEGQGAYCYTKTKRLVPAKGLTLLIDIGGGTWLSRLFDPQGEIIDQSSDEKGGVFQLASMLSFDDRLIRAIGGTRPDPGVIMNSFANQTHYYGEMNNASWRSYLSEHLDPWFKGIKAKAKSQYQPYFDSIKCLLLTGGGSLLVQGSSSGFTIVPEPRFANVLGMLPQTEAHRWRLAS